MYSLDGTGSVRNLSNIFRKMDLIVKPAHLDSKARPFCFIALKRSSVKTQVHVKTVENNFSEK